MRIYVLSDSPGELLLLFAQILAAILGSWGLVRLALHLLGRIPRLARWRHWPWLRQLLSLLTLIASALFWIWMLPVLEGITLALESVGDLFLGLLAWLFRN